MIFRCFDTEHVRFHWGSFKPFLSKSAASLFFTSAVFLAKAGALFNSRCPTC